MGEGKAVEQFPVVASQTFMVFLMKPNGLSAVAGSGSGVCNAL
jgi:hypothetical protein